MTDRLLVDIDIDGNIQVSTCFDGEQPSPVGERFPFTWPLDDDALRDLRWYLEDYLRAPYGVYGDRGARVASDLERWGISIFECVFANASARAAYTSARSREGGLELEIRSPSPRWLALPWELMRDPGRAVALALDGVGISRSVPTEDMLTERSAGGTRLRVLMIISRPSGDNDVGYRMIARPLLERMDAVRGMVDLVVLRPPTLERLREVLHTAWEAGEPSGLRRRGPIAAGQSTGHHASTRPTSLRSLLVWMRNVYRLGRLGDMLRLGASFSSPVNTSLPPPGTSLT